MVLGDWYLFSLLPLTSAADRVVRDNPQYRQTLDGTEAICVKAANVSKFPGYLLTFGRLAKLNDIVLVDEGAQMHCCFYLVESGELMLEDTTSGHHTYLSWYDASGRKRDEYSLQGDPRRRIIPVGPNRKIIFEIGDDIRFKFVWRVGVDRRSADATRRDLARLAAHNKALGNGMTLDVHRNPRLPRSAFEPRTKNTPDVPKKFDGKPLRQIHRYEKLGTGGFGVVHKAVDLATGKVWAVKEARKPGRGERWKADFKREVEKLAQLPNHNHIIRLEHHQGWDIGRPVQIFLPLFQGSVSGLLSHDRGCIRKPGPAPTWLPVFIDQVLSALSFVHHKGLIHRDLKPGNILYNGTPGQDSLTFCLTDFGITVSEETRKNHGIGGTDGYLAPEGTRNGKITYKSDVYAFGVMLLQLLDIYCPKEGFRHVSDWRDKLRVLGVQSAGTYEDYRPRGAQISSAQPGHSRIRSLAKHRLVPDSVASVLEEDPERRPSAARARQLLLDTYDQRGRRFRMPFLHRSRPAAIMPVVDETDSW